MKKENKNLQPTWEHMVVVVVALLCSVMNYPDIEFDIAGSQPVSLSAPV